MHAGDALPQLFPIPANLWGDIERPQDKKPLPLFLRVFVFWSPSASNRDIFNSIPNDGTQHTGKLPSHRVTYGNSVAGLLELWIASVAVFVMVSTLDCGELFATKCHELYR